MKKANPHKLLLVPVFGAIIFMGIYVLATLYYPGGSQKDLTSEGFSWMDNYWCNLLDAKAMNGQPNPASAIASVGMLVVCITLILFWYLFPKYIQYGKIGRVVIPLSGFLAMLVAAFLSSRHHDFVIYTATFFGLIALFGTFIGLFRIRWLSLFGFGIFNLLLTVLDLYIYTTKHQLAILPVIQKINFACFLTWIALINIKIYNLQQKQDTKIQL